MYLISNNNDIDNIKNVSDIMKFKLHPFFLLASFALGILFVYLSAPEPTVVIKFPTPYNVNRIVYKDKADNCYKYKADEVDCPKEKSKIKDQPIMEDFI